MHPAATSKPAHPGLYVLLALPAMPKLTPVEQSEENSPPTQVAEPLSELSGPLWRRGVILALVIGALAALAGSDTLHAALIHVLDAVEHAIARHPAVGATIFVAFAAVSAMLAFVSVAVIVPVAILTWGVPQSLAMLWLGWILGGICAYSIGRWAGRPVLRWLTAGTALDRLEARVQRNASFGLVLLFQLALPSEIPGYVLGLVRYRFLKYVLALALAELPFAATMVYVGAGLVQRRGAVVLSWGLALVILSVGALYVLRRRMVASDSG